MNGWMRLAVHTDLDWSRFSNTKVLAYLWSKPSIDHIDIWPFPADAGSKLWCSITEVRQNIYDDETPHIITVCCLHRLEMVIYRLWSVYKVIAGNVKEYIWFTFNLRASWTKVKKKLNHCPIHIIIHHSWLTLIVYWSVKSTQIHINLDLLFPIVKYQYEWTATNTMHSKIWQIGIDWILYRYFDYVCDYKLEMFEFIIQD